MDSSLARKPPDIDPQFVRPPPALTGDPGLVRSPPTAPGLPRDIHSSTSHPDTLPISGAARARDPSFQVPGDHDAAGRRPTGERPGGRAEEYQNNIQVEAPLYFRPDELTTSQDSVADRHDDVSVGTEKRLIGRGLPPTEEIRAAVAGLLVFGFSGLRVNDHARKLIRMGAGGVILFARNVEDPEQVARLCLELKQLAAPRPLIIMVDQEGGRVARLGPPFTPTPYAQTLGLTNDPANAIAIGSILGRELRAVHVDLNLAPVVDVNTNPANPVIGPRAFGADPGLVAEMGFGFIRGLQGAGGGGGVGACAKHYPGHGDTWQDSHLEMPVVAHDLKRMEAVEMVPFRRAVEADVAAVMVGHVASPALDTWWESTRGGDRGVCGSGGADGSGGGSGGGIGGGEGGGGGCGGALVPATLSRGAVEYLRRKLGFEGMVVTDCMEMGAIMKQYSAGEAAVGAVSAGVDLMLFCHTESRQLGAIQGIVEAVESGRVPYARVEEARRRVGGFVGTFVQVPRVPLGDLEREMYGLRMRAVGCKEHELIAQNVFFQAAAMKGVVERA